MPMPAAMTANGPIQLPVAAGVWANARPGSPKTASPAKVSDRRTTVLLCTCGLLVVVLGLVLGMMLRFLDRSRDVEHRQHHEDERLEKRHQDLQRIEKADREHDRDGAADSADDGARRAARQRPADQAVQAHQQEDDGEQDVTADHVAEESQRERERPGEVADDLDHEHQGLQRQRDRTREVREILQGALLAHADPVIRHEHYQRARRGGVQVAGRAPHAGHQADEIGGDDEEPERGQQRQIAPALDAHHVVDHLDELFEDDFEEVLEPARHEPHVAGGRERDSRQDHHHEPRVGDVIGNTRQADDRRMLDGFHAQAPLRADASPRTTTSQGSTVNPATSPIGAAHPVLRRIAHATVQAANRSPAPITQADTGAPPAAVTIAARATSQRKLRTASAPPARTPPATEAPATRPNVPPGRLPAIRLITITVTAATAMRMTPSAAASLALPAM